MRISTDARLPSIDDAKALKARLADILCQVANQLNNLTESRISARHSATTAAPTTGTWAQGDEVPNSTPTEAGGAGAKYVVIGWKCVAGGTPGTWVQMRTLTGN